MSTNNYNYFRQPIRVTESIMQCLEVALVFKLFPAIYYFLVDRIRYASGKKEWHLLSGSKILVLPGKSRNYCLKKPIKHKNSHFCCYIFFGGDHLLNTGPLLCRMENSGILRDTGASRLFVLTFDPGKAFSHLATGDGGRFKKLECELDSPTDE